MTLKIQIMLAGLALAIVLSGLYVVNVQIKARIVAEVTAAKEKTRADLAEQQRERLEQQVDQEQERQLKLVQQLQKARDAEHLATEVVEDRDRLHRLTQKKTGLIERQARKATTQVWADIEADSRD